MSGWGDVAAQGTDPDRLAAAVAVVSGRRGAARLDDLLDAERGRTVVGAALDGAADADGRRRAAAVRATWAGLGVVAALRGDASWPRLRCAGPPPLLAWRGLLPAAGRPVVALVGQRRATGYGRGVAAWLAEAVGAVGGVVVSGGAVGIDAAAHEAAAATGTVVVLGCGHDVPYPQPHARAGGLFDRALAAGGALVSEQLPGARPVPWAVRARNRLVAGMADAVVVVEGGSRSGALLTATAAAEADVPVLAVPGDVRAPGSVAPHRLLAEGAAPCTGPQDLWDVLGRPQPAAAAGPEGRPVGAVPAGGGLLPAALHDELARSWPRPLPVAALAATTGLPVGRVLAAVTRGTVAGLLAEGVDGVRLRRDPGGPGRA